ncbi:hypothetical protein SAMN05216359_10162 [Roseateles sp. YR242]|uniref:hypothetical protein n=1 Tax=Roseateles sp. YR242 TaxID=1855305 RepID=UPI0008BCCAD9|nr:hypothetical protein [Roseateles sp. YR242]SEK22129.1 hypothetical protein SAMN05216359_10162 [Roseateles sp. YR242]
MAGLKDGVVINEPAWKVPVVARKKLLKQPEITVNIGFDTSDVKEMPDKQFKAFEQAFEKRFTPEFNKMSNGWFGDMQKTMDTTEDALLLVGEQKDLKGDPKKLMEDIVDKANALLTSKCKTWVDMASKLAQKAYDEAYADSIKAMDLKITKAKAKIGVKIGIAVLFTLTATALGIAASVLSMGALAPAVIGAIVAAGKALHSSVTEIRSNCNVLANTIAAAEEDIKAIIKANAAISAAQQKTADKFDRVKAFAAYMSTDLNSLDKHVGQLDKFVAVTRDTTLKQIKSLQDMADTLAKAKAGTPEADKLEARILATQKSLDGVLKAMKDIDEVRASAKEAKTAAQASDPAAVIKTMPRLVQALTKVKSASGLLEKVAGPIQDIVSNAQQIA